MEVVKEKRLNEGKIDKFEQRKERMTVFKQNRTLGRVVRSPYPVASTIFVTDTCLKIKRRQRRKKNNFLTEHPIQLVLKYKCCFPML